MHQKIMDDFGRLLEAGSYHPTTARLMPLMAKYLRNYGERLPKNQVRLKALYRLLSSGFEDTHKTFLDSYAASFKRRYKCSLDETVEQAKKGNDEALFRLIEWDKKFLSEPWAVSRIRSAQEAVDLAFLKQLSRSVRKLGGFQRRVAPKYLPLAEAVQKFRYHGLLNPNSPQSVNWVRKQLLVAVKASIKEAQGADNERLEASFNDDLSILESDPAFRKFVHSKPL